MHMEKKIALGYLLDYYGAFLTGRQLELMQMHIEEDLSLSEIAEREHISRQGVHDVLRRAEHQLNEIESRLGLVRRVIEQRKGLEEIYDKLSGIDTGSEPKDDMKGILDKIQGLMHMWEDE